MKIEAKVDIKIGFDFERKLNDDDYANGYPNYFLNMDNDGEGNGDNTEWGNDLIKNWFFYLILSMPQKTYPCWIKVIGTFMVQRP